MVPMLETPCKKIIIENLSPKTIWEAYAYSVTFGDDVLRDGCREFFRKKVKPIEEALESMCFLNVPYGVLLDLLQINDTNFELPWDKPKLGILISDKELFIACHAWAVEECKRQNVQTSVPNKRKVLGDCVPLIRFPLMGASDIINVVLPTGILNEQEKTSFMKRSVALPTGKPTEMFLSSKQCIPVDFKGDMKVRLDLAERQSKLWRLSTDTKQAKISSVQITPSRRMVLSQVWLRPRIDTRWQKKLPTGGRQCSDYDVSIKHENRIQNRQYLASKVLGSVKDPILLLVDTGSIVLEANRPYTIRVEAKRFHEVDPELLLPKESYTRFLSKIRSTSDLDLDVTSDEKNEWIVGLTLSL